MMGIEAVLSGQCFPLDLTVDTNIFTTVIYLLAFFIPFLFDCYLLRQNDTLIHRPY
jgi:hypothetical protein